MSSKQHNKVIHWHILGAGSLGCLWAAYFAKSNIPCTLLLKNQQQLLAYQQQNEVSLEQENEVSHYAIIAKTTELLDEPISHLLVCTKAHQTLAAIKRIKQNLTPDCSILLMQNGMGVQQEVAALLENNPLFCAVTTDGAWQKNPYQVVHAGRGKTQIGSLANNADPASLLAQLPHQYLDIQVTRKIESELLKKLAINCAINPLSAIEQCNNGELNKQARLRKRVSALCQEITDIFKHSGHAQAAVNLELNVRAVINTTAANRSSMLQDLQAGKTTEIDYITGYLIQLAQQAAIACPENKKIFKQVKDLTE